MKRLLSVYLIAAALIVTACGSAADLEVTQSPLAPGSYTFSGTLTCPGESGSIAWYQPVTASIRQFAQVLVLNPWPLRNGNAYEMTLRCPGQIVLDPAGRNTSWVSCAIIAHQPGSAWLVTGQIASAPGQITLLPRDTIHTIGQLYISGAVDQPFNVAHGLCASGNDSLIGG